MEIESKGLGLTTLLTVVFVVLKLCKVITWSWWWILSPVWIGLILTVILNLIVVFLSKK